jgi:hypothetical protein
MPCGGMEQSIIKYVGQNLQKKKKPSQEPSTSEMAFSESSGDLYFADITKFVWQSQGELNPYFRREKPIRSVFHLILHPLKAV